MTRYARKAAGTDKGEKRAGEKRDHDARVGNGDRGMTTPTQQAGVEFQSDQKHVKDHADLGENSNHRHDGRWKQVSGNAGADSPQQRRAEQNSGR